MEDDRFGWNGEQWKMIIGGCNIRNRVVLSRQMIKDCKLNTMEWNGKRKVERRGKLVSFRL